MVCRASKGDEGDEEGDGGTIPMDLMVSIVSLKRAALQFGFWIFSFSFLNLILQYLIYFLIGATLNQPDANVVRVSGANTMFSCYDIGEDDTVFRIRLKEKKKKSFIFYFGCKLILSLSFYYF